MLGFPRQEDVEEDVPLPSRQSRHPMDKPANNDSATFMRVVFVAAIGALLYGSYCLVQSPLVQQEAAAVPKITCNQLIQNGAGKRRHVTLTDACLSSRRSVA